MDKKFNGKAYNATKADEMIKREKYKNERLSENRFSQRAKSSELKDKDEMMQLGSDYYNSGKSLEELDEKIRNHRFFVIGYERAKRLALIAELDRKEGKIRR